MKIIGHRGGAGLGPENTIEAIRAGLKAGVDGVEFDVRVSKDGHVVLCHDDNLQRTYGIDRKISDSTLEELLQATRQLGSPIPTLEKALQSIGTTQAFIEAKGNSWAMALSKVLKASPQKSQCVVIAFNHHELFNFGQKCPAMPLYALEHHNSMDALQSARIFGFEGIDLNYWLLNPLIYWLTRRHNLKLVVYTVNKPWLVRFLQLLYPQISITTDIPERLQFVRDRVKRTKKSSGKV